MSHWLLMSRILLGTLDKLSLHYRSFSRICVVYRSNELIHFFNFCGVGLGDHIWIAVIQLSLHCFSYEETQQPHRQSPADGNI